MSVKKVGNEYTADLFLKDGNIAVMEVTNNNTGKKKTAKLFLVNPEVFGTMKHTSYFPFEEIEYGLWGDMNPKPLLEDLANKAYAELKSNVSKVG